MELVTDRFVVSRDGHTIDLATGHRVVLLRSTAGGPGEQARWAGRCARLSALRHPAMGWLLDYGTVGDGGRFEAWRMDEERRDDEAGRTVRSQTAAFLLANGLTAGAEGVVVRVDDRVVCLPGAAAGYECSDGGDSIEVGSPHPVAGLTILPRHTTATIEAAIASEKARGGAFALWGPAGAGVRTALLDIARMARLHGVVPVCDRALGAEILPLLHGRSTLVIVRGRKEDAWRAYLGLSLYSPRPHLLVYAGEDEAPGMVPVVLERFSEQALVSAVRPAGMADAAASRAAAAARHAQGLPGRFAAALWRGAMASQIGERRPGSRVAERAAEYGVGQRTPDGALPPGAPAGARRWPVSADLVLLRERQRMAIAQIASGAHASGERLLRQVIGGQARREDWESAGDGAIALAGALIRRGRCQEAAMAVEQGRGFAQRAGSVALMLKAAVLSGRSFTNLQHLDDAETVLQAARATARGMGDAAGLSAVSLELSRCLFWRGRYEEAHSALAVFDGRDMTPKESVALTIARTRVALGRGDLSEAVALASTAVSAASTLEEPSLAAAAWGAAAHAHLAVGDYPAVQRDVETGLVAARRGHDPLRAMGLRLLGVEAERRSGRRAGAMRAASRLGRAAGRRVLPPILAARVSLLAALLKDDRPEATLRHARATGLAALVLFAPAPRPSSSVQAMAGDLIKILRCCQSADEDARVLCALCTQLRASLHAASVAVLLEDQGRLTPVASDGGKFDMAGAARVQLLGDVVGPRADPSGSDGGAPIRYGGRAIGVLAVRWMPGDEHAERDWSALLSTAAVAAAPALAAEQSRRLRPQGTYPELIGASAPMERVRSAIERAALAPFAVLVEGESGTGKELVARALHRRSARRDRPCCTLNCAALPDDLVESELFGHARGAFTGALAERPGVFEEAHTGTLFLDEIGELAPRAQAKVLRAIQDGEIRRVGENAARRVDVRIVAATNRDLRQEVGAGRFRLDLLYRLDVIRIALPPLRARPDDIPPLAEHFWREASARVGGRATLGAATLAALARYDWPGNVRELQNVMAALAVRCPRRGVVSPTALPPVFDGVRADGSWRLDDARRTFEAAFVRAALARAGGHRTRAAEEIGVTRQGLTKLITRLGLADAESSTAAHE